MLQHEQHLKDETKDKLAFLNTLPRKRKSLNPHIEEKYGNDINSTGSFLSDLSITQSEDDFLDVRHSRNWQKHRPSLSKNSVPFIGSKRSRLSGGGGLGIDGHSTPPAPQSTRRSGAGTRRSSAGVNKHTLDVGPIEKVCATTKVTIPQDGYGAIRAESIIESTPMQFAVEPQQDHKLECIGDGPTSTPKRSPFKHATAPQMTPSASGVGTFLGSPAQNLRPTLMRQHNFASKTFIRTDTCMQCQKK